MRNKITKMLAAVTKVKSRRLKKPAAATKLQSRRSGVFYSTKLKKNKVGLRSLQQDDYPSVVGYSEAACKSLLESKGVTLTKKGLEDLWRWRCHAK